MRIYRGGWWAIASLASVAASQHANTHVIFDDTDFENPYANNTAVLTPYINPRDGDPEPPSTFSWISAQTVVKNITLLAVGESVEVVGSAILRPDTNSKESATPKAPAPSGAFDADDPPGGNFAEIGLHPKTPGSADSVRSRASGVITGSLTDGTQGSVTIVDFSPLMPRAGQKMYFQINWLATGGASYSRYFTVASNDAQAAFLAGRPTFNKTLPPVDESMGDGTSTISTGSPVATKIYNIPSGSSPSSDASSGKSGDEGGNGNGNGNASWDSGGGSGGLTTGAIAGIAVGAGVAGILAAGALIWLLIVRRRRRQQAAAEEMAGLGGPYGNNGNSRTQELMAEKEANAGVDVSPHSPYSDDGNNAGGGTSPVAAAAAASMSGGGDGGAADALPPPPNDRSFTPYSDHQRSSQAEETRSTTAATAGAQGRSTPYVHLVEEGMTEDDIRRLEAEERELDQAIEQAGRR